MAMRTLIGFAVLLAWATPCLAQAEPPPPDIRTVEIPDLSQSAAPAVVAEGWKYFLFRHPHISFEQAYLDFSDCYRFMAPADWSDVSLNRFVPWESPAARKINRPTNQYGIVGALLGSLIDGTLNRRDYQAKMRACLEPRGYVRYSVPQRVWEQVSRLPKDQWAAVQAKIAQSPDVGGKTPDK